MIKLTLYDIIVDIESRIEDANLRKNAIEMKTLSLENIYAIIRRFNKIYDIISDEDKKNLVKTLVREIHLYKHTESSTSLKSIELNFPVYYNGSVMDKIVLEKDTDDENIVCLIKK